MAAKQRVARVSLRQPRLVYSISAVIRSLDVDNAGKMLYTATAAAGARQRSTITYAASYSENREMTRR